MDNFLEAGMSLSWDTFHDQAENDNLAEDQENNDVFYQSGGPLQLQYRPGQDLDLHRVFTYHGVLPIRATPLNLLPEAARLPQPNHEEATSQEEQISRPQKKRKRMRKFLNRIKNHRGGRDRHDDDEPHPGPNKMVSQ